MKIYLVWSGHYDEAHIVAAYLNGDKAQEFVDKENVPSIVAAKRQWDISATKDKHLQKYYASMDDYVKDQAQYSVESVEVVDA